MAASSMPSPSATRTTMVMALVWSLMASRVAARVPRVPALPMAAWTLVTSTGVSSGKATALASEPVQTMPMTAMEMVRIGRVPSLSSTTRTP
ncbi:hypothetical protein D3C78_1726760 [compost metagenome]